MMDMQSRVTQSFYNHLLLKGRFADSKRIVEDERLISDFEESIRQALAFYQIAHEYEGVSWDGIEKFHFALASVVDTVAIESAGWYSYDHSTSGKLDGKDWRLIAVPSAQNPFPAVSINCHSVLHNGVWSLSTTIHDELSMDTDELVFITDNDPWVRSMMWSLSLANHLEVEGMDYSSATNDMHERVSLRNYTAEMMTEIREQVNVAYQEETGKSSNMPDYITICIADWNLVEGKIGSFKYPGEFPYGILTLGTNAFKKNDLAEWVLTHEMIHAAIGQTEENDHGDLFQTIADKLGIPEEYQD